MNLPYFELGSDPGPSFSRLLVSLDVPLAAALGSSVSTLTSDALAAQAVVPHGTTIASLRFSDGVILAGDRRATSGNVISERTMNKVAQAGRRSGIAISGAAGPAVEMIRIFQTELEHYEKVEGVSLSLDGQANKLSQMIRANMPLALNGLVVIPLFAGFDHRRSSGRIYKFDVTGGRYEEADFHATGSGGQVAGTVIRVNWEPEMDREAAIKLVGSALIEASEEDSATGGPDPFRQLYPTVAVITESGYSELDEDEARGLFDQLLEDKQAVLRRNAGVQR